MHGGGGTSRARDSARQSRARVADSHSDGDPNARPDADAA